MNISTTVHIKEEKITATNNIIDKGKYNAISIEQNNRGVFFIMPIKKTKEFIDAQTKALFDTTYSELSEEVDKLVEVVNSKNETIEELTKALDASNNEVLRLENVISDLKCDLENEVDYLKNGKMNDGEELY